MMMFFGENKQEEVCFLDATSSRSRSDPAMTRGENIPLCIIGLYVFFVVFRLLNGIWVLIWEFEKTGDADEK